MGTWGVGIFENDTAADVRGDFEVALAEGLNFEAATRRILDDYVEAVEDAEDGPVVWLALAALQFEHGSVQPWVREQALAVIDAGEPADRWGVSPEELAERGRLLSDLRARLLATM